MRTNGLAGAERQLEVRPFPAYGGNLHCGQKLHAVPAGLGDEPVGQVGPGDPVREAGVVVDALGQPGLPAEAGLVHHQRVDALAGGIDGGRQPGRPAAHDDQVVEVFLRLEREPELAGELVVTRLQQA